MTTYMNLGHDHVCSCHTSPCGPLHLPQLHLLGENTFLCTETRKKKQVYVHHAADGFNATHWHFTASYLHLTVYPWDIWEATKQGAIRPSIYVERFLKPGLKTYLNGHILKSKFINWLQVRAEMGMITTDKEQLSD